MSKKKTREKQLAKLAARRAAERRHQRNQRIIAGVVVVAVIVGGGAFTFAALTGGSTPKASPSKTPTPTPTTSVVACGGSVPKAAGTTKPTFSKPPKMTIDTSKTYTATLDTSCGKIGIRLDAKAAPQTVNSFVFLAHKGFYDGLTFHRVANSLSVIQGGDPNGNGTGGPGYTLKDELTGHEQYTPGTVAMANSGPNTGGSQFFIVTGSNATGLPKSYTVFGKVVSGMSAAKKIQSVPVTTTPGAPVTAAAETPTQKIYINSVTISKK